MNYLSALDLGSVETLHLLDTAARLKAARAQRLDLSGRHVALYFEKPSVRTRTSFTVAVHELGAQVIELSGSNTKVGKGEHIEDFAKVVGRYCHLLVARVFEHETLELMAKQAGVPVVNALSDLEHPCQALADLLTVLERFGTIDGRKIAFIGEGNNVAASLALLATKLGAEVRVAAPAGYGLRDAIRDRARTHSGRLIELTDPLKAAEGADVLYTDTWVSMGDEAQAAERAKIFAPYRIDRAMLARAHAQSIVLHCLPAVRGQEIDRETMYGDNSAIWDQAENRLHVQKALLLRLFGVGEEPVVA